MLIDNLISSVTHEWKVVFKHMMNGKANNMYSKHALIDKVNFCQIL